MMGLSYPIVGGRLEMGLIGGVVMLILSNDFNFNIIYMRSIILDTMYLLYIMASRIF